MDFTVRSTEKELMDDPNIQVELLQHVYEDINFCNKMLGGESITLDAVWDLVKTNPKKSYMILDVGCGNGNLLCKLSHFLSKKGVSHKMIGIDLRADVLTMAREKCKDLPHVAFYKKDIFKANSNLECDILINTLTMHHFDEESIAAILNKFVSLARTGIVINDLQRSKISYLLFKVFGFFFLRTDTAKHDGLVSVSKGFKKAELLRLAKKIPNVSHKIRWKWAFRYVWVMNFNRHID